jgi:hypothetical protein
LIPRPVLASAICIFVSVSSCVDVVPPSFRGDCPGSAREALARTDDDEIFIGTGWLIRFVPSPDPATRGYEVNLRTRNGEPYFESILVLAEERAPDRPDGIPVLVYGARTDRARVVAPGPCDPLHEIREADVDWVLPRPSSFRDAWGTVGA